MPATAAGSTGITQVHRFIRDPSGSSRAHRHQVTEDMSEHRSIHYSGYLRNANDFYATPHWVTDALLRHVRLRGPVWEPCCGTGAISQALDGQGYTVVSTDIADYGYGAPGIDILECRVMPAGYRALVTNPPLFFWLSSRN